MAAAFGAALGLTFAGQVWLRQLGVPVIPQWHSGVGVVEPHGRGDETVSRVSLVATSTEALQVEGDAYRFALEDTAASYSALEHVLADELIPVLVSINTQSQSGNLEGIVEKLATARLFARQTGELNAAFAEDIQQLASVEVGEETGSLTSAVADSGMKLSASIVRYLQLADVLFSGSVPSGDSIKEFIASAQEVSGAQTDFKTRMSALYAHFGMQGMVVPLPAPSL